MHYNFYYKNAQWLKTFLSKTLVKKEGKLLKETTERSTYMLYKI